jgi:hypothetical protein
VRGIEKARRRSFFAEVFRAGIVRCNWGTRGAVPDLTVVAVECVDDDPAFVEIAIFEILA